MQALFSIIYCGKSLYLGLLTVVICADTKGAYMPDLSTIAYALLAIAFTVLCGICWLFISGANGNVCVTTKRQYELGRHPADYGKPEERKQ